MYPYQPHHGMSHPYASPQEIPNPYQGLSHHEQQHQQVLMMQQQQQLAPGQVVVVQTTTTTYHQQPVYPMPYGAMYSDQFSMMMNQSYEPPQSLDQLPFFSSVSSSVQDKKTEVEPVLFNFDNLVVDALIPNYLPAYCLQQKQNTENNTVVNNTNVNNTNNSTLVDNLTTTKVQNNSVNFNPVNTISKQSITNVIENNNVTINNTKNVTNQVTNITNVTSKVVPSTPTVSVNTLTNTDTQKKAVTCEVVKKVVNNSTTNTLVETKDVKKDDKVVNNTSTVVKTIKDVKNISTTNTLVENKDINHHVTINNSKTVETNIIATNNASPVTTTTHTSTSVPKPTKEVVSQKTTSELNTTSSSVVNTSTNISTSEVTISNISTNVVNNINNITNVVNNVVKNSVVNNEIDKTTSINNINSQTKDIQNQSGTTQETVMNSVKVENTKNIFVTNNISNTTNNTTVNNITNTCVDTKNVTAQQNDCSKPQRKWVIETTIENFKNNFSHLSGVSPLYLSTLSTLEKYQSTLRKTLEMATGENVEKFTALAIQCDNEFEKSMGWLERTIVMLEREKVAFMNWTENKNLPNFLNMTVEQLIEQCKKLPSHPKFDESVKTLIDYFQRYGKLVQYLVLLRYYYTSIHKKYDPPKIVLARTEKCSVSKMYNDNDFDHTWDALKSSVSYWLRPCQFSDKPVLFENDTLDVNRIRKGLINNAYFISAVIAAGQKSPEAIKRRFVEDDFVGGRHTVKLFNSQNREKFVTVDDCFPIEYLGKPIATSSSAPNEFWPHILEKAYAKMLGGYHLYCHGGNPGSVLQAVFGCKESIKLSLGKSANANEIWPKLQEEHNKGSIMMVYTNSGYNENTENDCHAYVVQQVIEIKDNSNVVHRLIKLFNPWGLAYSSNSAGESALEKAYALMEWKGRYSDGDSNWNDYLIKNLNIESKNDGVFWMCSEDFCSHWSHLIAAQLPVQEQ